VIGLLQVIRIQRHGLIGHSEPTQSDHTTLTVKVINHPVSRGVVQSLLEVLLPYALNIQDLPNETENLI
jgi:hypothetical protein